MGTLGNFARTGKSNMNDTPTIAPLAQKARGQGQGVVPPMGNIPRVGAVVGIAAGDPQAGNRVSDSGGGSFPSQTTRQA